MEYVWKGVEFFQEAIESFSFMSPWFRGISLISPSKMQVPRRKEPYPDVVAQL